MDRLEILEPYTNQSPISFNDVEVDGRFLSLEELDPHVREQIKQMQPAFETMDMMIDEKFLV